jgi:hypothetical protein
LTETIPGTQNRKLKIEDREPRTAVQIEFLFWEDCPSHERALELLREVIAEENIPADIALAEVTTEEEAERLKFPGSPTIRVAGQDIVEGAEGPYGLTCRAYVLPSGKISPLPSRESIAVALRRAR